jgi:hypothetical protein
MKRLGPYGLLAEFDDPTELVAAIHQARAAGYRRMEAYTPFPVEEVTEALHVKRSRLPLIVLIGGLIGCLGGFGMQWWGMSGGAGLEGPLHAMGVPTGYDNPFAYPVVVSGKPENSWPMFIPITFELTILCAVLAAVLGMLALNGLPMPYHPLFHSARFAQASRDKFFLCVQARDPLFDLARTRDFLAGLHPRHLEEVPL